MANIVQVEQQNLVNGWLGIAAYTAATTPMKLALTTTSPTSTAAGTEVTGGSYGRQTITFGAPTAATPSTATATAVSFTSMPAAVVTSVNVYDNAGTPIRRAFGDLTASKTTAAGDTLTVTVTASIG